MRIKSRIKDYYDYVAHQYGGGDPRIVYVRGKITHIDGVEKDDLFWEFSRGKDRPKGMRDLSNTCMHSKFEFQWCVVCGAQYLIAAPKKESHNRSAWSVITDDHPAMPKLKERAEEKGSSFWVDWIREQHTPVLELHGKSFPYLLDLSRKLKSPVFNMNVRYNCIYVDDIVPNLKMLGFDKLFSPEQMYQNISMWVGNTLRDNPDDDPPKTINNEERIIAHGFDLKSSFRNTKKG